MTKITATLNHTKPGRPWLDIHILLDTKKRKEQPVIVIPRRPAEAKKG